MIEELELYLVSVIFMREVNYAKYMGVLRVLTESRVYVKPMEEGFVV